MFLLVFLCWPLCPLIQAADSWRKRALWPAIGWGLMAACGLAGYFVAIYSVIIVSYYYPLPWWAIAAALLAYLAGYCIYRAKEGEPLRI